MSNRVVRCEAGNCGAIFKRKEHWQHHFERKHAPFLTVNKREMDVMLGLANKFVEGVDVDCMFCYVRADYEGVDVPDSPPASPQPKRAKRAATKTELEEALSNLAAVAIDFFGSKPKKDAGEFSGFRDRLLEIVRETAKATNSNDD